MRNLLSLWLPRSQCSLLPPSPAAPAPAARWLDTALSQARLPALLQAPAGITLLAPTDEAMQAAGLTPAGWEPQALQRWLLGHLTLARPRDAGVLPLLNGSLLRRAEQQAGWLDAEGRAVQLVGRPVMRQGLQLQHIDRALAAPCQTLWQRVAADPALTRLATALEQGGVHDWLGCSGPFTLFAPTGDALDHAAARLGLSAAALWRDGERLRELLLHHLVPGRWSSSELPWAGQLRTLAGSTLRLDAFGRLRSGDLAVPLARGSDQPCSNGLLHRLPEALLPTG
ncbi:MAG: fasciclin domain-containing protein [Roseateles sp.]|jgi:uncharacterized surface protein with fasciclin (FAS1) repeats|nr:hypothetical protein [Methylibium sp.]